SIVCGHLFVVPVIEALLGVPSPERDRSEPGLLGRDMPANDEREDYLRSSLVLTEAGWEATPFERQDSSMLGLLAQAQALAIRPVFAPAARKGDPCRFIRLR
ncbi:MAG: molybdopterin molybdenumtransferase MoeA, partial [Beijerinckiaceae bacterium]|nr:molybdopterin molybdenumtransferase MoeA [Beijerinckiaceae bacterium]